MTVLHLLRGAVIGAICWIVGYVATLFITDGMSAAANYAVLVGWWLTAYVSSIFALPILASVPLAIGYLVVFFIAAVGGYAWFYHDVVSLPVSSTIVVGLVQSLVVASPIVLDWSVRRFMQRFFSFDS